MEGCSGLPDAPKFWLFRSVHEIAHNCEQRAAQNDSFSPTDMLIRLEDVSTIHREHTASSMFCSQIQTHIS